MIVYYSDGKMGLYINDQVLFRNHFQLAECEAFIEAGYADRTFKLRMGESCHAYTTQMNYSLPVTREREP